MGNIVLLDELTINKIAAGEVIERPASVIKEMVENSIDAKATSVTVEIRNGGISYIRITDNGKGIAQDDLEMAFERHATSKIRNAEDLNTVMSMGFRGEALASIAAISNVELISKTENQETGYKVTVEGGHVINKEEIGCQTGTAIIVRNLFFNTPVRYKFLKKDYTETGYIEDVITRIALVNPHVAIKLVNTGKTIISTNGNGNLRDVVYSIYGKDVAQGVLDINYKYDDVNVVGLIGKPEISRSNRSNQIFFVNNRYIKDRILTSAVEQAYKNKIETGKFAFAVLNLQISPQKVDVNVHPAKLEVRFEEENKIFKAVYHAIEDALARNRAESDTVEQIDNIIIQSSENSFSKPKKVEEFSKKSEEKERKFGGFLSRRKEKYDFGSNNIIEALYNEKKSEDYSTVNTSDVLQELKTINDNIQKDIQNEKLQQEQAKKEKEQEDKKEEIKEEVKEKKEENKSSSIINKEEKKLPDGKTYTYIGENKDKIESLLRQLHPELAQNEKSKIFEEKKEEPKSIEEPKEEPKSIEEPKEEQKSIEEPKEEQRYVQKIKEETRVEEKQEEYIKTSDNNQEDTVRVPIVNKEKMKEIQEIQEGQKIQEIQDEQEIQEEKQQEKPINKFESIRRNIEKLNEKDESSNFNMMYEKLFGRPVIEEESEEQIQNKTEQEEKVNAIDIVNENVSMFEGIEEFSKPTYKFIGIVFGSYIVVEIEKEMYIINEKLAREKVLFENLKKSYSQINNKDSQMLLLPDIINLSSKQMEIARENIPMFTQAGFVLEDFGDNTIKLSGVPTICLELNTKELFYQIVEGINTVARTAKEEKENKFLETIAEKVEDKKQSVTTIQEVDDLMNKLLSQKEPFVYLYNKQVALKMTKYDIERKFSRK